MVLVGYYKRILVLTVGAPGSTHDARLLRNTGLCRKNLEGAGLPSKTFDLGEKYGKLSLITIGDSAFPTFLWLLKGFSTNTNDSKKTLYNLKLKSARVVTENMYGMLKRQWRILYKKTEMKIYNLKYIVMSCVILHNLCIGRNDPWNPRWRLAVEELELNSADIPRHQSNAESNKNATKIANWLWEQLTTDA